MNTLTDVREFNKKICYGGGGEQTKILVIGGQSSPLKKKATRGWGTRLKFQLWGREGLEKFDYGEVGGREI